MIVHVKELLYFQNSCKRLLSGVNLHVFVKVSFLNETLSTLLAGERFLSSVSPHVVSEVLFICKTFSTLRTYERFLSTVNSHVVFKV